MKSLSVTEKTLRELMVAGIPQAAYCLQHAIKPEHINYNSVEWADHLTKLKLAINNATPVDPAAIDALLHSV